MTERPVPAAPLPVAPLPAEPIPVEVVYAVPLAPRRTPWALAALVGLAGAALGLFVAWLAMLEGSPYGRLGLPRHVVLPALFPLPSIWWSTAGPLAGARVSTLVLFGQYPAYGFVIGQFAARGRVARAAAAVLLVHAVGSVVCYAFSLPDLAWDRRAASGRPGVLPARYNAGRCSAAYSPSCRPCRSCCA